MSSTGGWSPEAARALAREARRAYGAVVPGPAYDELPEQEQQAWEAAAVQVADIVCADG